MRVQGLGLRFNFGCGALRNFQIGIGLRDYSILLLVRTVPGRMQGPMLLSPLAERQSEPYNLSPKDPKYQALT